MFHLLLSLENSRQEIRGDPGRAVRQTLGPKPDGKQLAFRKVLRERGPGGLGGILKLILRIPWLRTLTPLRVPVMGRPPEKIETVQSYLLRQGKMLLFNA